MGWVNGEARKSGYEKALPARLAAGATQKIGSHDIDGFAAAILTLAARYFTQYILRVAMYTALFDLFLITRMEGV